ncbi:MAG TPA: flagellar filament capping protein FliD, partial [Lachnospiraceae bacterium]|nr:flagellar filament capping protein FliD [Lachnospiraceae bacterium]
TMVNTAGGSFEVGGKKMFLSDFGISTLGYYDAEENERYALHIDGDADDSNTASKDDKLRSMIATDPEAAASFFSQFSQTLYTNLYSKMGSTKMSSIYKVYNDKQMKEEHTDWEKKITELESKLSDMEDNYYKKFSAMETALAKMSSNQNAVSSLLGGN